MPKEEGRQEMEVEAGTGATTGAGLDAGTDREQTNRELGGEATEASTEVPGANISDANVAARQTVIDQGAVGDASGKTLGEMDADTISGSDVSKTGAANSGAVGRGTGESSGATKGFETAAPRDNSD